MTKARLKVNQKIDVEVESGRARGNYLCKVAEISNNMIKITHPYIRSKLAPLGKGRAVRIYFTGNDAAYMFKTFIAGRITDPVPLLILKQPGNVHRIQRREFFRMEVNERARYYLLDKELEQTGELRKTTITDLSGGGAKMTVDEGLIKGSLLELYLDLPELENTAIIGKVVNRYNGDDNRAIGVEFLEINNYVREKIISWLFDYQRELRKKGLL